LKQSTKRLDLAFEPGAANFVIVPFGLDILEFRLQSAHLVDALLTITARGHCVGFALFDFGNLRSKGTGL
jgi:hypothetical protein